jgi:hypothetical protein
VISFGNYCFDGGLSLPSLIIPGLLINIGKGCFEDCFSLQNVSLSLLCDIKIVMSESWEPEKKESFFSPAIQKVFLGCPFNSD